YHHVSGEDLYHYTREILSAYDHEWIAEPFVGPQQIPLQINNRSIQAGVIFDSRPPKYSKPARHESFLNQSFLGWNITCEQDAFDPEAFVMMDFSIEQHGATQFMYVLPFDRKTALVECTRFGMTPIVEAEAEMQLRAYIGQQYGNFRINEQERGSIPMSSAQLEAVHATDEWISTGARAGNLKPSTGYSFMNSCRHAEAIALKQQRATQSLRFPFYDRLLLKLLEQRPEQGKRIFEQLFRSVPIPQVLRFLSEEISFREELQILSKLPKRLFVTAALNDVFQRSRTWLLLPWLLLILLFILQWLEWEQAGLLVLLSGLLLVGLPHGAIDHLLETGKLHTPVKPMFILKYLSVSAMMGVIWYLSPAAGLCIFMGYSAWHFGETEFSSQGRGSGILSFICGASLLGLILCTHITELNMVLRELHIPPVNLRLQGLSWILAVIYVLVGGVEGLSGLYLLPALGLPLLQCFGLFFIADHSVKSSLQLMRGFSAKPGELYLKALPFTLGALLLGVFFFSGDFWASGGATGLFFIFLSCLSFPHVLAMHRFYRNLRKGT
ncbi:MAG: beta-carotene 15,15'-dioxygenase, Brp/Blh family, partial [Bacteroidetes bacterium]|nr:beta-carotene 15,15'-dioxygenase, Brp/Blh family [Bacteroidota bacterium]